jgi:hypothetical protein
VKPQLTTDHDFPIKPLKNKTIWLIDGDDSIFDMRCSTQIAHGYILTTCTITTEINIQYTMIFILDILVTKIATFPEIMQCSVKSIF